MKTENTIQLLDFLNHADAEFIAAFVAGKKIKLDEETIGNLIKAREAQGDSGFTDLEQVSKIKGFDESVMKRLQQAFDVPEKHKGMVKSRTTFVFRGEAAPKLKDYEGEVIFEKSPTLQVDAENKVVEMGETEFNLYYAPSVNKEQLFKAIKREKNFLRHGTAHLFAIQLRNDQFILTSPSSSGLTCFHRSIYWASKFRIYSIKYFAHNPNQFPSFSTQPNMYMSVSLACEDGGRQGLLRLDPNLSNVKCQSPGPNDDIPPGYPPEDEYYFDISGIIDFPYFAQPELVKSFTLMNYVQEQLPATDPREFITLGGGYDALIRSNNQTPWVRDHQFRLVEVLEDISLRSIDNMSHVNQFKNNMYLRVDAQGNVSSTYIAAGSAHSTETLFDLFVFYGYWEDRHRISCRVVLQSKRNNRFLSVDQSENVSCSTPLLFEDLDANTSFYVEQGWGTNNDRIFLKTFWGKYLYVWQNTVGADISAPNSMHEQFEVMIP